VEELLGFPSPTGGSPHQDNAVTTMKGCVFIATSVDGFIAGTDGNLDWLHTLPDPSNGPLEAGEDFGFAEFLNSIDVIIMGRTTFEVVVGFGPEAWAYKDIPLVVLTRNPQNVLLPDWMPPTVSVPTPTSTIDDSPHDLWTDLKRQGYKRAYIDGGRTIQTFLNAGMIHELTITKIPILLGNGIPLFGGSGPTREYKLKHSSTRSYPNGYVISKYDVMVP
jgi:dihydrofolate reductase